MEPALVPKIMSIERCVASPNISPGLTRVGFRRHGSEKPERI